MAGMAVVLVLGSIMDSFEQVALPALQQSIKTGTWLWVSLVSLYV